MSFTLEPGTIPHIQHIYQPTAKDWDIGSGWAINLLHHLDKSINNGFNTDASRFRATYKIDDRVSLKVAKINGEHYVGYKGLNSPYLDTYEQIRFMYQENKPYLVNPLGELLRYASHIIPKTMDNVEVQVGILWTNPAWHAPLPYEVTPNVVTYKLLNAVSSVKLIVSVVSATGFRPDGSLYFIQDLSQFCRPSFEVLVLNPNIPFENRSYIRDPSKSLELAENLRANMLHKQHFDTISGYEPLMCKFLNYLNRTKGDNGDTWLGQFLDWHRYVHTPQVVDKLKLQKNKDAKQEALNKEYLWIEDNWQAFDPAFDLCAIIRYAALELLDDVNKINNNQFTQGPINEGVVLSYAVDSNQVIFKVVPPEFSHANFEKNKDL